MTQQTQFPTLKAILTKHGGIKRLKQKYLKLHNNGYMLLVIEWIGDIPDGDILSFAHTYIQNGDVMYDPEVTFLVKNDIWQPMTYCQHNLGIYQEVLRWTDQGPVRKVSQYDDLVSFVKFWDRNLRDQGFLQL